MATSTSPSASSDRGPARPRRTTTAAVTAADVGDVEGRTFRNRTQTMIGAAVAVAWPLVLGTIALGVLDRRGPAAWIAVGGVLGCGLAVRAARMRLEVGADGLRVVGVTRARFVAWPEVVGVVAGDDGLRVLVPEGRGPILHSISRTRRSASTGTPGFADALAERLTEEARMRQAA